VRSNDSVIAGVASGLAKRFGVDPWVVRLLWIAGLLFFGTGVLLYLIMAVCLPREDKVNNSVEPKVLGVCLRLADHFNIDVGLVRVATVLVAIASLGATILAYLILYFVMPEYHRKLYP
jgi:phage shock protein PspC (stress-responsive transcriptional regulator)